MADQSVRAVIFDLGGVLIDWNPRLIFQEHFATHGVMEAFMADVFWQAHKACHDSDAPFEQTLAVWRDSHPHYTHALDAMAHHWDRAIMGPIPETVSVLDALVARKAGAAIGAKIGTGEVTVVAANHPQAAEIALAEAKAVAEAASAVW